MLPTTSISASRAAPLRLPRQARARTGKHVALNEYQTWTREKTGTRRPTARSARRIEAHRREPRPAERDHREDLPRLPRRQRAERQARSKFQLSDGVGCEACHGGSEKWIESRREVGDSQGQRRARHVSVGAAAETRAAVPGLSLLGTRIASRRTRSWARAIRA